MKQDLFLAANYLSSLLSSQYSDVPLLFQQRLTVVSVRTLVTFGGNVKQSYPSQVGVSA